MYREQTVYKVSAIAASAAVIALAVGAVHYRFAWHMKQGHEFPTSEALATFCLTIGGIVSHPLLLLSISLSLHSQVFKVMLAGAQHGCVL